ncbi:MAG: BioY family transporter [Cereibacter sphaeroides]|uniref:Biotin transporter n=1 Tax=Cereibacter sphaeroides TaxID=1063 RepID=A0A2W5UAW5_CERSP|nr:MAG: BioY family transporter [Cereibacter sphaeroides]
MERNLAYVALFAALIAILTIVPAVTLPSGVPVTAQTLGVMLAGAVLGSRLGFAAVALYVVLGLIGLPIFSGGTGGFGVLAGPTGGFLIGFPFAAFVTGFIVERWRVQIGLSAFVAAVIGGIAVLYAFGIPGMALALGKPLAVAAGFATPFIPGDLLKAALAALITQGMAKARPQAMLSRR